MRTFVFFLFLHFCVFALAQDRCATSAYVEIQPGHIVKGFALQKQVNDNLVIRIPVVVHVLYNNASQDIPDAQIKSGIDALNRDYRRRAADTVNTPGRFRNLAADVQIEFYLATADPLGRKTSGILRKQTARLGWASDDKMKSTAKGGDDGWDCKSYLNIWIVNLIGASGYSSLPGCAAAIDGVVISYNAFGTINTPAPFNIGRTAVHEVGHWLGLKHIWGDAQCGDDGVDDTPTQGFFTKGCPSGFRTSCNNGETGDMYMNYMDYTDDACMNLFTQGQRTRMRSLFAEGGPRASLLQSKGLNEPWTQEAPLATTTASLYPNPASEKIILQISSSFLGKTFFLFNSQGQLERTETINSLQQTFNVADLKPGVYILKGENFSQKFVKL